MKIGLIDVDSHNFPNLPLMKISAYYKAKGDTVEFVDFIEQSNEDFTPYEKVYVSKIFGQEYTSFLENPVKAKEIVYGGTGFAITIENGKEVYHKDRDKDLPYEIEHIYPDYSLYPQYCKNTAYGFLTRGCCNNCDFCLVSKKEGMCSRKVADLSEFWQGQKEIKLLDPNILACKNRKELLQQLIDSKAKIDFTQGLDARFITVEIAEMLKQIKVKMFHFAFDFIKNEKAIIKGLKTFVDVVNPAKEKCYVYVLTNYNTTFTEDYFRIKLIQACGLSPDVRIYRKDTAPQITRDLQRWCNNRRIYRSQPDFMKYVPRTDGKTIKQIYFEE